MTQTSRILMTLDERLGQKRASYISWSSSDKILASYLMMWRTWETQLFVFHLDVYGPRLQRASSASPGEWRKEYLSVFIVCIWIKNMNGNIRGKNLDSSIYPFSTALILYRVARGGSGGGKWNQNDGWPDNTMHYAFFFSLPAPPPYTHTRTCAHGPCLLPGGWEPLLCYPGSEQCPTRSIIIIFLTCKAIHPTTGLNKTVRIGEAKYECRASCLHGYVYVLRNHNVL